MAVIVSWSLISDIFLCSLYVYLLIRLATASDDYFRTPFYTFFVVTGFYSVLTVTTFQTTSAFVGNPLQYYVYKPTCGLNALGAEGATFGKAVIAIHRYFVIRSHDFAEKKWSRQLILRILIVQFVFSVITTAPNWPADYVYKNMTTNDNVTNKIVVGIADINTLIMKITAIATYVVYIICNSVFTVLTSRQLLKLRRILEDNSATSRKIMVQQRNMFIIVIVCSLTHLVKALHQFSMAALTYTGLDDIFQTVWTFYPLINGLATYAAPICLVALSPRVRARLIPIRYFINETTVESITSSSNRSVK